MHTRFITVGITITMISTTKLKQQLEQMLVDSQETRFREVDCGNGFTRPKAYLSYNGEKLANNIKGIVTMLEVIGE